MNNVNRAGFILFMLVQTFQVNAGQPTATVGSLTNHGGIVSSGSTNVFIAGQGAARLGDTVICPVPFHIGGNIATGSSTVFINGLPAARLTDTVNETLIPSTITTGKPTVLSGN